jgi:D-alanyl-D-alanine carboxypeptidase
VVLENCANPEAAPGPVGDFALRVLRAAVRMQPLPEVPNSGNDLESAGEYAGTYEDAEGRKLTIVSEGKRLALLEGEKRFPLDRRGRESFQVDHPDLALYLLRFGRQAERVVEVFHGGRWYRTNRYQGPRSFPFPKEWASFVGHYRTANLWFSNFRIVVRKGKLLMIMPQGLEALLVPAEPGWFQIGEEHTAERIRFDQPVRGLMQRANFSGVEYYRTFTP